MGFLICSIHPVDESSPATSSAVTIETIRPLALCGVSGLFAHHLPQLAGDDNTWALSGDALLRLAEPDAAPSDVIIFDLAPKSQSSRALYRLVEVTGRTVSLITDALFRFKVLTPVAHQAGAPSFTGWEDGPERYEQLRLEGGTSGGNWAWGESPTAVCATVLNSPQTVARTTGS
jgi:hypothetical protein